jgi:hypothetical protein
MQMTVNIERYIEDMEEKNKAIEENKLLKQKLDSIKFYIEQSNIKDMLWGKEILKMIGDDNE